MDLYELDFTGKIALVFGNDIPAYSEDILPLTDGKFIIPQVGMIQSLNISVACAVTLYEAFRQKKMAGHYNQRKLNEPEFQGLWNEWSLKNRNNLMKSIIIISLVFCSSFTVTAQEIPAWKITDLEAYIHKSTSPVIINFWATFCKPCLEEIPYFEETVKKYKKDSVTILLVSLDMQEQYPKVISSSIAKRKFSSTVVWLNETNADYFCPKVDSTWSGSLPSSLFINNKTGYHKFLEEPIPREKLEKEIAAMIGKE